MRGLRFAFGVLTLIKGVLLLRDPEGMVASAHDLAAALPAPVGPLLGPMSATVTRYARRAPGGLRSSAVLAIVIGIVVLWGAQKPR